MNKNVVNKISPIDVLKINIATGFQIIFKGKIDLFMS